MPYLKVTTNQDISEKQKDLMDQIVGEAITVLPKIKREYLMTQFEPKADLRFAGSSAPCALVELRFLKKAYEVTDDATWDAFFALLTSMTAKTLHIPEDRVFINLSGVPKWAANGKDILKTILK